MSITTNHLRRVDDSRERSRKARQARARARKELDAAKQADDQDAIGVLELAVQEAEHEVDTADELLDRAVQSLPGRSNRVGVTMREDPQAQAILAEIAESNVPLQNYVKVGEFMTAEELAAFGRRGVQAAGVTLPADPVTGQGLGLQVPPAPPQTLLSLFPQSERIVGWLQRSGVVEAAVAPHGSVKAQGTLTYVDQSEEASTVAVLVVRAARSSSGVVTRSAGGSSRRCASRTARRCRCCARPASAPRRRPRRR